VQGESEPKDEVGSQPVADPGDLGRRVAQRRKELGLDRNEVARRAAMDPGYLAYVEESSDARPSPAACTRLAVALGTTVNWLRGGGVEVPPGVHEPPRRTPILEEMSDDECVAHLRPGGIGRVVFDDERGPVALPVNFRMLDGDIVFRTGDGSIAHAVQQGKTLSLEVDHLDEALGEGWSVLATGSASEITDPERREKAEKVHITPWAGGDRHLLISLTPRKLTGRRISHR
jgi:nitroimidazol reductase NimA-like FMN-containing flavoprotein (pyridoxamine 5'-phosphate oxidase superfamily)